MQRLRKILFIGMATIWSVTVCTLSWGQAIMPLSGTKGAGSINDGISQYNKRNLDSAASHFQKSLKTNPRSAVAHYNLALAYNQMGQREKASRHFQKASKFGRLNPFIQNSRSLQQNLQTSKNKR